MLGLRRRYSQRRHSTSDKASARWRWCASRWWVGSVTLCQNSDRRRFLFAGYGRGCCSPRTDFAPNAAPVVPADGLVEVSTMTALIGSRTSARRSARSQGPLRQEWVPPRVSAQKGLKQTQQSLRPLPQEQPRQLQHFPEQRVPRRWCAARLLSRAQEARAKPRCRCLGIRFSPVK